MRSQDGRWIWDGYRWRPAPRRFDNWLLVVAVVSVTMPLWLIPVIAIVVFVVGNIKAGFG